MISEVIISGIKCYAYHGCMDEEGIIGGNYIVDVTVKANIDPAIKNDTLEDTIDYVVIHRIVKEEMALRSKLIEHVAGRIVNAITKAYDTVQEVLVKVTKLNPPVNGQVETASVVISGKGEKS